MTFDDGYLKNKGQMTMVPWEVIRKSQKDTAGFVLHADKTKLEGAKCFSPNKSPDMHDATWNNHIYD